MVGICLLGPRPILDWRGVSGAPETAVKGKHAAADPEAQGRRRARRPIAREPGSRDGQRITQQGRVPAGCRLGQAGGRDGSGSSLSAACLCVSARRQVPGTGRSMTSGCSMKASSRAQPSGDDAHCSATARADQRVHLVDLLDQPRPGVLRLRWGYLTEFLDASRFFSLGLPAFPPVHVAGSPSERPASLCRDSGPRRSK